MKQCSYKSSISSQEESTELGGTRGSDLNGDPRSKDPKLTGIGIMWLLNIKMPISGAKIQLLYHYLWDLRPRMVIWWSLCIVLFGKHC